MKGRLKKTKQKNKNIKNLSLKETPKTSKRISEHIFKNTQTKYPRQSLINDKRNTENAIEKKVCVYMCLYSGIHREREKRRIKE